MSTQRGNASRTRCQKHKNLTVFSNSMHDTSKRTKALNSLEVHGVCQRCKEIIEWKIKYKKYKPLTAPKTCTKCRQKTITGAYRTICRKCASELRVCEKCGETKEIIPKTMLSPEEQMKQAAAVERQLKSLPERKRRTLQRYMARTQADPATDPATLGDDLRDKIERVREGLQSRLSDDLDDLSLGENSSGAEQTGDEET